MIQCTFIITYQNSNTEDGVEICFSFHCPNQNIFKKTMNEYIMEFLDHWQAIFLFIITTVWCLSKLVIDD